MKHFLQCLTLVAVVVVVVSIATAPPPLTTATHQATSVAAERKAVAISKTPAPTKTTTPATVDNAVPAATAPAQAAPIVYPAGCANYLPLVQQYDWNVNMAMAIMQAENTGCDPAIDNAGTNSDGSTDYGLFQVNSIHADMVGGNLESLRTPSVNVAIAYSLSHDGTNWTAWNTYKSGKYLQYLK